MPAKGNKRGPKPYQIDFGWLVQTAADINAKVTTIEEARFRCPVRNHLGHYHPRKVSVRYLSEKLKFIDDRIDIKKGRPMKTKSELLERKICEVQKETKMGVTKCYEKIVTKSIDDFVCREISHRMVYDEFIKNDLLQYRKPQKKTIIRSRYVACNPMLIWHIDLHDWNKVDSNGREYLAAFIDDFSRKVMHADIIPDKTAMTTSNFLKHAIEMCGKPYSIWSDNGGEFKAEFDGYLFRNNIRHVYTKPRNPQQNGKVERFWRSAEKCSSKKDLLDWIPIYNKTPHMGLDETIVLSRKAHLSPDQAFDQNPHWNPTIAPEWIVDGEKKPFLIQDQLFDLWNL